MAESGIRLAALLRGVVLELLHEGVRWEDAVLGRASVVASKAGSQR
jgi:hypothetical protein